MKLFQFHPLLCLAGILLPLAFIGSSPLIAFSPDTPMRRSFRILGIPTPQEMIPVTGASPLTIPAGKIFVVTGVGFSDNFSAAGVIELRFNGNPALEIDSSVVWNRLGVAEIPPGLVAPATTAVTVFHPTSGVSPMVLGYLADA